MRKLVKIVSLFLFFFVTDMVALAQFTWTSQSSGVGTVAIKDVTFIDLQNGWAVGELGYIIRTVDGGVNWTMQTSPVTVTLQSIEFSSNNIGWIVGDDETLLKSTDGGASWFVAPQPSGTSSHLYKVHFVDADHGWILGFWDNFRTIDGGNTWITFDPAASTMQDVQFLSPTDGWICSTAGYLAHSNDGGVSWTQVSTLWGSDIYALYALSVDEVLIAGSAGFIHKTSDGGVNWTIVNSGGAGAILDIDFLNAQVGVAVGNSGYLLETFNGGLTWTPDAFATCDLTSVDMVADGTGWTAGYCGTIYKSAYGINDLYVFEYLGMDTLCENVDTEIMLSIFNAGPAPIESADFIILDGSTTILTYHWTGYLAAGVYENVNLGSVSINHEGYYTCGIYGDSSTTNNVTNKYIHILSDPATMSGPHNICIGDSIQISISDAPSFWWLDVGTDSLNTEFWVSPSVNNNYYAVVKTDYCNFLDSVTVNVDACTELITAISPNGDGLNDVLELSNIPLADNIVKIYNRWGDLINSYTNYDNINVAWNGTDWNGNSVAEGTYFYVAQTSDFSFQESSWVQVLR